MKLRVVRKAHTHAGKRYAAGEVFDGTEKLLKAFPDRLEPAAVAEARADADAAAKAQADADKPKPPTMPKGK